VCGRDDGKRYVMGDSTKPLISERGVLGGVVAGCSGIPLHEVGKNCDEIILERIKEKYVVKYYVQIV